MDSRAPPPHPSIRPDSEVCQDWTPGPVWRDARQLEAQILLLFKLFNYRRADILSRVT